MQTGRTAPVALLCTLLIATGCFAQDGVSGTITAAHVMPHLSVLAHDSMRGRASPGREFDRAAAYVAAELERAGVSPLRGDYLTRFGNELRRVDPGGIQFELGGRAAPFRYGRDYAAMYGSRRAGEGELVVLTAAELKAPESTERVRGRVLLALMPNGSHGADRYAALLLARGAGAAALILGHTEDVTEHLESARVQYETNPAGMRFNDTGDLLPTLYASHEMTRYLVSNAGERVLVAVSWQVVDPGVIPNTAGVIEGTDPSLRGERIVLVAHLDHLGVRAAQGPPGDSVYNGADDNASGVAALLEVAGAIASERDRLRRSVVFLFTGGEESGQLGAKRFVAADDFEPESVVAVVNLDMIGRNAGDQIRLLGAELSSLGDLSLSVLDSISIGLRGTVEEDADLFRRSDHFTFATAGIPSLWLFSGFHDDYHEPSDELERLDVDKVARVAEFVRALTLRLAGGAPRPVLTEAGRALIVN